MKLIDELELLSSETDTPFRRAEAHLEIQFSNLESAVEAAATSSQEAIESLSRDMNDGLKQVHERMASISAALWTICVLVGGLLCFQVFR